MRELLTALPVAYVVSLALPPFWRSRANFVFGRYQSQDDAFPFYFVYLGQYVAISPQRKQVSMRECNFLQD